MVGGVGHNRSEPVTPMGVVVLFRTYNSHIAIHLGEDSRC